MLQAYQNKYSTEAPTQLSEMDAKLRKGAEDRANAFQRRKQYSEVVRKEHMPFADEETHEELISAIIKQTNPMSKGLGHVSSNYNPANARNPNITAPKSQYDSY